MINHLAICPSCGSGPNKIDFICQLNKDNYSITSDSKYSSRLKGSCHICEVCGHIFNEISGSLNNFYSEDYQLLTEDVQRDQLLFFSNGKNLYRSVFQAKILNQLCSQISDIKPTSILEVGAGKGLTGHKFSKLNSDSQIKYYLHEVSQKKYSNFWNKIAPNCIHDDSFKRHDLVASFFTLEHCLISDIEKSYLERVNKKGVIILTVPNLLVNAGDLMVADHINHFTSHNLESLFRTKFSEKFNFAISKELYPRSLTILLSPYFSSAELEKFLVSISATLPSSSTKEDDLQELLLQLENANKFILKLSQNNINNQHANYAFWGSGFYAKYFGLHMPNIRPKVSFDSNPDLVNSKLTLINGLDIPIENSNGIIDYCLENQIKNVILSVSPQTAASIQSSLGNRFQESEIKLINPWISTL